MGSNDRLNFAVIGLNSRAYAHLSALKANKKACADCLCLRCGQQYSEEVCRRHRRRRWAMLRRPRRTIRNVLQKKDVDAITIATPDHWHAPMAIAGLQAGSMFMSRSLAATIRLRARCWCRHSRSIGKLVQMGTQQRSSPHTIEIVDKIHDGLIGRPISRRPGTATCASRLVSARKLLCPRRWTGICGRGRLRGRPYKDNRPAV